MRQLGLLMAKSEDKGLPVYHGIKTEAAVVMLTLPNGASLTKVATPLCDICMGPQSADWFASRTN